MRRSVSLALLLAACSAEPPQEPPVATRAQALDVPGQFPTLQAALAAAQAGATVNLAAGDYTENVSLPGGVTIHGAGRGRTTIHGAIALIGGGAGGTLSELSVVGSGAGTGVSAPGGGLLVDRCEIRGFQKGVVVTGQMTVRKSLIAGNGWGIELNGAGGSLVDDDVINNTQGGVASRGNDVVDYLHDTIVGNGFAGRPEDGAGGLALGAHSHGRVQNDIIVGNQTGITCDQCVIDAGHNDVWGNRTQYAGDAGHGAGDLAVDPAFVDPAGQDFHLRPTSPCVDAGVDLHVDQDADGGARLSGIAPDLGAHEYHRTYTGLVVNEVMANPADERAGEYVELYNGTHDPIDLDGFVLDDGDSPDVLRGMGGPTVLPSGGYALVIDPDYTNQFVVPAGVVRLTTPDRTLGDGLAVGDPVRLIAPDRSTVISSYDHPFDPGNGVSAERVAPAAPDGPQAFVAAPCGSSPGLPNCAAAPPPPPDPIPGGLAINEVMANPLDQATGEFVELLNEGAAPVDAKDLRLSDGDRTDTLQAFGDSPTVIAPGALAVVLDPDYAGQYDIPAGTVLLRPADHTIGSGLANDDPLRLLARDDATVLATFSFPFNPGHGVSIERVTNRGDVQGNWVASPCPAHASPGRPNCAAPAPPRPATVPHLVIDEVMANPLVESTGEFVEVVNRDAMPVDLAGLLLFDGDSTDRLVAFHGGATIVQPGAYAVIVDPDYDGSYPIDAAAVRVTTPDHTLGTGLSTNDPVSLLMPDGVTVIDRFADPFDPGDGRSAERVDRNDGTVAWVPAACDGMAHHSAGAANCAHEPPPPPPPPMLPDVVTNAGLITTSAYVDEAQFAPESCAIVEGCVGGPGLRRLLRFSIETQNIGDADLVLGNPQDHPERFEWSPCHGHYHFNDYARYSLVDGNGNVVAPGHKQSFCLLDSRKVLDDGAPAAQYGCANQGISRGWADVYGAGLDCQWIDITGVAPGQYTIRVEVNFNHVLAESNYDDNVVEVPFTVPNDDITAACDPGAVRGANQECGWTAATSVACQPGDRVEIGCTGAMACNGLGSCAGNPALRACDGDGIACHANHALASGDDACGTPCPDVAFTCPADGAVTVYTASVDGNPSRCEAAVLETPPPPPTAACETPAVGPHRDCGWQIASDAAGAVQGRACQPGATLTVGCNPMPAQMGCGMGVGAACQGDPVLRVCPGDAECRDAAALASNDDACPGDLCSETTFVCPAGGTYTVMTAAYSNPPYTCTVAVQ